MHEKLKSIINDDAFFFSVLLILIGIVSFGLGRQSITEKVQLSSPEQSASIFFTETTKKEEAVLPDKVQLVASRSGTKYHLLNCPGASQIKEENKIYFDSIDLALAAGYTPAANCPGLN